MKFEYVASAISGHMGLNSLRFNDLRDRDSDFKSFMEEYFKSLSFHDEHKFSVLFNAFTEKTIGKTTFEQFFSVLNNLYSDSGGLQIITRKLPINDDLKEKIFDIQSKYSNIGMSFDNIPVSIEGETSIRNLTNRYFQPSMLDECARQTATDLKKQIRYMIDHGKQCRPMMIIQGNDFASYQRWVDIHGEILNDEELSYIKGISIGGAALGIGFLEEFKKLFYFLNLQFPDALHTKHIHLLGVGALYKYIPLITFKDRFDGYHISYDSSTHACTLTMGDYYVGQSKKRPNRFKDKMFYEILSYINNDLKSFNQSISEDDLYKTVWYPKGRPDVDDHKFFYTIMGYFGTQVKTFISDLERMKTNKKYFETFATKNKCLLQVKTLQNINDIKQFDEWCHQYGYSLDSNPVRLKTHATTVEEFF